MIDPSPLFSIITITKDNEQGLKRTSQSVQNQSFQDYEWIIVDGDSTDGTKDFLQTLSAQKIIEPDKGIYDAMNKGIKAAIGRYLIFLNAGDCFADPDILATLSNVISSQNPDFIYGDALETNGFYKKAKSHERINQGMFTHHQAMIYARNKIGDLRYDDTLKIAADYGFTVEFLRRAEHIHYMPCAICIFEDGGISQRNTALGRKEQFALRHKLRVCGAVHNILIFLKQKMAADLRANFPKLYYKLRGK